MTEQRSILVPVPDVLRDFMTDVAERIRTRDDSATMYSDDLLQCERGYGGRVTKKEFEFVFFPNESERWTFRLLADEVDEIGSGHRNELRIRVEDEPPIDPWSLGNLDLPQGLAKLASIGITGLSEQPF